MKRKAWRYRLTGAYAAGVFTLTSALTPLTVNAQARATTETLSDGIQVTWEEQGRGYVSKIPSNFSGNDKDHAGRWNVPTGVYKIEDEAIEGGTNSRVTKIFLPESFETKEYSASGTDVHDIFDKFTALTDIDVDGKNKNFAALNGVLYSADHNTIIEYPIGRTSINLGSANNSSDNPNPKRIGKWAFSGLNLKDFSLPGSVTDYEEHALTGLTGVDRMVLPSSPAMLKSYTFENTGFKEIVIPNNISGKSIAANWLITDHDVTVTIPDTITSIDDNAIVLQNNAKVTLKAPKDSAAENLVKKLNNSNITFEETAASSTASTNATTGSSSSTGKAAQVNNQVTNMDNKNKVSARVNGSTANDEYTLVIKDSAGNGIKRQLTVDSKTSLMAYDLSLVDKDGNAVTNFNNVEITLPVPSNMDRSKGTIDVVTLDANGKLETLRTSVKQDGDAVTATFLTSHFTEFAIRYIEDSASSSSTASTSSASVSTSGAATTGTTNTGAGTTPRNSSNDVPKTGDTQSYQIMLMTMAALAGAMFFVMIVTHGAKRKRA